MVDTSRIVSVATSGAGLMLVTTVVKKVITFALRQVLFRQANPTLIGAAEIQLELLLSSLLFLTRESIRTAVLRVDGSDPQKFQHIINLSWLSPLVLACICAYVVLFQGMSTWNSDVSPLVIQLYCLGALFEACGEPFHNAFRNCLNISAGANAETVSIFLSSVVTVVAVVYLDLGILGFGLGQVVKGLFDFLVLAYQACTSPIHGRVHGIAEFLPRIRLTGDGNNGASRGARDGGVVECVTDNEKVVVWPTALTSFLSRNFDATSLNLTASAYSTCLIKHLLTQSDKIMLSLTATNHDQGVYAVTHNYAALVTRMVFYPLEESARLAFAKCSVGVGASSGSSSTSLVQAGTTADDSSNQTRGESLHLMEELLFSRLALVAFIGSVFVLFGTCYVRLLVHIVLSAQWRTEATVDAFVMFCYYIAVMGVNGISEAFVHSVADAGTYRVWINGTLAASSVVFAAATYYCSVYANLGTIGVIVGNIASMTVRICCNGYYIHAYFARHGDPATKVVKTGNRKAEEATNAIVIVTVASALGQAVAFSNGVHQDSQMGTLDHLWHLGMGVLCFALYLGLLWLMLGKAYILSVVRFGARGGEVKSASSVDSKSGAEAKIAFEATADDGKAAGENSSLAKRGRDVACVGPDDSSTAHTRAVLRRGDKVPKAASVSSTSPVITVRKSPRNKKTQ